MLCETCQSQVVIHHIIQMTLSGPFFLHVMGRLNLLVEENLGVRGTIGFRRFKATVLTGLAR